MLPTCIFVGFSKSYAFIELDYKNKILDKYLSFKHCQIVDTKFPNGTPLRCCQNV